MGSFIYTDYISRTPIMENSNEKYLVNFCSSSNGIRFLPSEDLIHKLNQNMVYITDHYKPTSLPFIATYSGYGTFDVTEEDELNQMIYNLCRYMDDFNTKDELDEILSIIKSTTSPLLNKQIPAGYHLSDRESKETKQISSYLSATRLKSIEDLAENAINGNTKLTIRDDLYKKYKKYTYSELFHKNINFWLSYLADFKSKQNTITVDSYWVIKDMTQSLSEKGKTTIIKNCYAEERYSTNVSILAHLALAKHFELHPNDNNSKEIMNYLTMIEVLHTFQEEINLPFQPVAGLGTQQFSEYDLIHYNEIIQKNTEIVLKESLIWELDDLTINPDLLVNKTQAGIAECKRLEDILIKVNAIQFWNENNLDSFVFLLTYEQCSEIFKVARDIRVSRYEKSLGF